MNSYSIGEVATLAGITVRTLHHYDEVGLLSPQARSTAGYRRYCDADVERLRQILTYRELGFALDKIAMLVGDPKTNVLTHLRRQRRMLLDRIDRMRRMVDTLEFLLEAQQMNIKLTPAERLEIFGDHDPDEYAEEVEQRWGGSAAYAQSMRRTAAYTAADWREIKAEGDRLNERMAEAMAAGSAPDSVVAMDLAEEHRQHISRWFYDCGHDVHGGLGELYVNDPRFAATYNKVREGLADWISRAIAANSARA